MMAIMGMMGYRKRTAFLAGLTVAQISEFSLILAALGVSVGHLGPEAMGLITTVGLITIALSTSVDHVFRPPVRVAGAVARESSSGARRSARPARTPARRRRPTSWCLGSGGPAAASCDICSCEIAG